MLYSRFFEGSMRTMPFFSSLPLASFSRRSHFSHCSHFSHYSRYRLLRPGQTYQLGQREGGMSKGEAHLPSIGQRSDAIAEINNYVGHHQRPLCIGVGMYRSLTSGNARLGCLERRFLGRPQVQQPIDVARLRVLDIGEARCQRSQARPRILNIYSETIFFSVRTEGYGSMCTRVTYGKRPHHTRQIWSALRGMRHLRAPSPQSPHTQPSHGKHFGSATLGWRHSLIEVSHVNIYIV